MSNKCEGCAFWGKDQQDFDPTKNYMAACGMQDNKRTQFDDGCGQFFARAPEPQIVVPADIGVSEPGGLLIPKYISDKILHAVSGQVTLQKLLEPGIPISKELLEDATMLMPKLFGLPVQEDPSLQTWPVIFGDYSGYRSKPIRAFNVHMVTKMPPVSFNDGPFSRYFNIDRKPDFEVHGKAYVGPEDIPFLDVHQTQLFTFERGDGTVVEVEGRITSLSLHSYTQGGVEVEFEGTNKPPVMRHGGEVSPFGGVKVSWTEDDPEFTDEDEDDEDDEEGEGDWWDDGEEGEEWESDDDDEDDDDPNSAYLKGVQGSVSIGFLNPQGLIEAQGTSRGLTLEDLQNARKMMERPYMPVERYEPDRYEFTIRSSLGAAVVKDMYSTIVKLNTD